MIKPTLRYPGGKSHTVEAIAKLIPTFGEFHRLFLEGDSVFV